MTDADQDRTPPGSCSPCRGTGRVVSNLGGTPTDKPCPWCSGTGARIAGHDAQHHWRETAATP
ncbi:MAG: hypothetical protein AVDCRST_MAG53-1384 [uncultured Solirubrobacteraceae bacterium]|uniref:Chaperone protein DnaJ n=1 Tax=uncultured Solirubrobacteraceae bacterium TaxID=1162706 RepID=A0A6J4RF11_9ACTN|nr:MAG: hypothetical protein AVDCRST_MAG53-1384 [uncultured Solirubrobacteraceae bacterium]